MDLLFQKRVDLILQAYEPGYERSKQLSCATAGVFNASCVTATQPAERGKGSTIVILGTGGKVLYACIFALLNDARRLWPTKVMSLIPRRCSSSKFVIYYLYLGLFSSCE